MKKKVRTIEEIKGEINLLDKKRRLLHSIVCDREEKETLPKIKKKFEGKFFKYDNGFNHKDRWPLYIHCRTVTGIHFALADTFQSNTDKECSFKVSQQESLALMGKQITRREYLSALKKFKSQLDKLGK